MSLRCLTSFLTYQVKSSIAPCARPWSQSAMMYPSSPGDFGDAAEKRRRREFYFFSSSSVDHTCWHSQQT